MSGSLKLGSFKKDADHLLAAEQVKDWTRERFSLPQDAAVLVTEIACTIPGCPPLETVIAFWDNEERHHFKIFKPVSGIVEDDLPPAWLKSSLAGDEEDCGCC